MKNVITITKNNGLNAVSLFGMGGACRKDFDSAESLSIIVDNEEFLQATVVDSDGKESTMFGAYAVAFNTKNADDVLKAFHKREGQPYTTPRITFEYSAEGIPTVSATFSKLSIGNNGAKLHQDGDAIVIVGSQMSLTNTIMVDEAIA